MTDPSFFEFTDPNVTPTPDAWRVFRIISEFVDGFETMTHIGPSVSIFGSARTLPSDPYYKLAVQTAKAIARKGFAVITGGGGGVMEAANRGAQQAKGISCGLSIQLPFEANVNSFIDRKYDMHYRYFFVRKVMFIRYAQGYVFFPGGVGTMDEMFEALTLIQTEKIHPFPIYLMGTSYWKGLMDWMSDTVLKSGCIGQVDIDRMRITDDPEEVANGIELHYQKNRTLSNF